MRRAQSIGVVAGLGLALLLWSVGVERSPVVGDADPGAEVVGDRLGALAVRPAEPESTEGGEPVSEKWQTRLSWRVFDSGDETVPLEIPGVGAFLVDVSQRRRHGNGSVTVAGKVRGKAGALAVFARHGMAVSGWATGIDGRDFRMTGVAGESLLVEEENPVEALACGGGLAVGEGPKAGVATAKTGAKADPSLVDILVGYTDDARARAGSSDQIQADIHGIIALSNARFAVSRVDMELRLVGTMEVDYAEGGSANEDLRRLRDGGDGYLDELHVKRVEVGADLVALLVATSDYGGIAYLGGRSVADASLGFSVTHSQSLSHAFTHEIGHNCGCAHDPANAGGPGRFSYSYGHRFTGSDGVLYRTQMSYAPGTRLNGFSNPATRHAGVAMGTASADNAGTINLTRTVLADYRATAVVGAERAEIADVDIDDRRNSVRDGKVQAGEKIDVLLPLRNNTGRQMTGVEVTLSSPNPDVLITDGDVYYPNISSGSTGVSSLSLRFTLDRRARAGSSLLFDVTIESNQGKWSDFFLVTVAESPVKLVYDRISIDDDNSGSSKGDGDGVIEPGEEIELLIAIRNIGRETAERPSVRMQSPGDPLFFLQDASNSYQDISSQKWKWSTTDFDFRVLPGCPMGRRFRIPLEISSRQGTWTDEMTLVVGSVRLSGEVVFDDDASGGSRGNGDGVLQVGEVVELDLELTGTGQTYATGVNVELVSDDPLVQITNEREIYGQVNPGVARGAPTKFSLSVAGNGTLQQRVDLRFLVRSVEAKLVVPVSYVVDVEPPDPEPPEVVFVAGAPGEGDDLEVTLPGTLEGLVYTIERSADLEQWTEVDGGISGTGGDVVRVIGAGEESRGATVFLRVVQKKL